jgi:hypothetical protein
MNTSQTDQLTNAGNDQRFDKVPGLSFEPWVGRDYGRRSKYGMGVLLLGESHYGDGVAEAWSMTRDLTAKYVGGEARIGMISPIS